MASSIKHLCAASLCVTLLAACSLSDSNRNEAPKPVELDLELTGPTYAAAGAVTNGFVATLTQDKTTAVEDTFVKLTATKGSINAPPENPGTTGANTDEFGRLQFSFQAPTDITEPTTVTITAEADVNGKIVEAALNVTAKPDTFQFTEPTSGSPIRVGSTNAQRLRFQWTRVAVSGNGSEGVDGLVTLSSGPDVFFVVQGSVLPPNQPVTIATNADSSGDFDSAVSVGSNQRGTATITATDTNLTSRKAQLSVAFVDAPASINLEADPLTVQPSPSQSRFSTLTATVVNDAGVPVSGAQVTFQLTTAAGSTAAGSEGVFPTGGISDSNGVATSRYEAGDVAGKATVKVCVVSSTICDSREITVETPAASP